MSALLLGSLIRAGIPHQGNGNMHPGFTPQDAWMEIHPNGCVWVFCGGEKTVLLPVKATSCCAYNHWGGAGR